MAATSRSNSIDPSAAAAASAAVRSGSPLPPAAATDEAAGVDELCGAVLGIAAGRSRERPTPRRARALGRGEAGDAARQLLVDRLVEIGAETLVHERSGRREDERHRDGKRGGEPGTDRQAAHPPSSRSR